MTRRPAFFLITAVVTFLIVVSVWVGVCLYEKPPATVPVGQTASINGIQWHLDFIKQVPQDDPSVTSAYVTMVDGAAYVEVQYTYEAPTSVSVCTGLVIGADRQWMASGVRKPSDPGVTTGCTSATNATQQMIAVIPPSAVNEINAVDISMAGYWVRLAGRVSQ